MILAENALALPAFALRPGEVTLINTVSSAILANCFRVNG